MLAATRSPSRRHGQRAARPYMPATTPSTLHQPGDGDPHHGAHRGAVPTMNLESAPYRGGTAHQEPTAIRPSAFRKPAHYRTRKSRATATSPARRRPPATAAAASSTARTSRPAPRCPGKTSLHRGHAHRALPERVAGATPRRAIHHDSPREIAFIQALAACPVRDEFVDPAWKTQRGRDKASTISQLPWPARTRRVPTRR